MSRVINFSAGPGTLPVTVLEELRDEMLDFRGTGISLLEHSHRGEAYTEVHQDTLARLRAFMGCEDTHEVLLMQGGASGQFALLAMNFLRGGTADYVDTGIWSKKALAAANCYGTARWAASGRENGSVVRAPRELDLSEGAKYVHLTTNATVSGVQYHSLPDTGSARLALDVSSDFLHKPFSLEGIDFIYAGAQKNVGPAGVTIVAVKKDWIQDVEPNIPDVFRYPHVAEKGSLANTGPTFSIYVVGKVLRWLEEEGGPAEMQRRNEAKAACLYGAVNELSDFYRCPVEEGSRSLMNAVFHLPSEELTKRFIAEAAEQNMVNLKGHRTVGGIRASMYNAMELAGVEQLAAFMRAFAKTHG